MYFRIYTFVNMKYVIGILLVLLSIGKVNASSKYEIRAAWLVTENGKDWPCGVYDEATQKESFVKLLDRLSAANFNTLYIQMQACGGVAWLSSYLPAMSVITGDGSKALSYDVAEFVIAECHKRHIECHAWVVPFKIGTTTDKNRYVNNKVVHPLSSHPELCITYSGMNYLDPGIPDARKFIYDTYKELVSEYEFDGINLDLTCYQGLEFGDTDSFFEYNPDYLNKEEWRRENLNQFVSELSDELKLINPDLRIGQSPIGVYKPVIGYENQTAYNYTYQDPCLWLNNGWLDYLSPKMFHNEKNGFSKNLTKWCDESIGGNLVIGISSDMILSDNWDVATLTEQIEKIRGASADGVAVYSVGSLLNSSELYTALQDDYFYYPSHVIPYNNSYPNAPRNVIQEYVDGGYRISWDAPEGTTVRYYSVYLTDGNSVDVNNLDYVVGAKVGERSFVYSSDRDLGLNFAVTAFDKSYNESVPSFAQQAGIEDVGIQERFMYHNGILYVSGGRIIDRIEIYSFTGTNMLTVFVNDYESTVDCMSLGQGVFVARVIYKSGGAKVKKIVR